MQSSKYKERGLSRVTLPEAKYHERIHLRYIKAQDWPRLQSTAFVNELALAASAYVGTRVLLMYTNLCNIRNERPVLVSFAEDQEAFLLAGTETWLSNGGRIP